MPLLRAYLAVSLDGFIAGKDGGVKWLEPYSDPSLGFEEFNRTIDTIVVGRMTFDQTLGWGAWPEKRRSVVLTRRPIADPPPGVEAFGGDVRELVTRLKSEATGDIWHMGGGRSLQPFHEAGLIDRWELFVMPVLLGQGVPLFAHSDHALESLELTTCRAHKKGIVELHYEPAG